MKEQLKNGKKKLAAAVIVVIVLAAAFYFGGNAPGMRGWQVGVEAVSIAHEDFAVLSMPRLPQLLTVAEEQPQQPQKKEKAADQPKQEEAATPEQPKESAAAPSMAAEPSAAPQEPVQETVAEVPSATVCTISIRCDAINAHTDWLKPEKAGLVPTDGWLLQPVTMEFQQDETVFNVLQRVCKQNGIQMEYEETPVFHTAYIEGIGNLYEFDCGELSGWTYCVNGVSPNYGCSGYALQPGDVVEWIYTCDMGGQTANRIENGE